MLFCSWKVVIVMDIGAKIKKRRLDLGLTQMDLANKMGYTSKAAICKVENGYDNLTTNRIIQFAKALDLSVSYLMGWDDEVQEDPDEAYTKAAREFYGKYLAADRKTRRIIDQLLEEGDE